MSRNHTLRALRLFAGAVGRAAVGSPMPSQIGPYIPCRERGTCVAADGLTVAVHDPDHGRDPYVHDRAFSGSTATNAKCGSKRWISTVRNDITSACFTHSTGAAFSSRFLRRARQEAAVTMLPRAKDRAAWSRFGNVLSAATRPSVSPRRGVTAGPHGRYASLCLRRSRPFAA
jgi:hypothetical protein